MPKQLLFLPGPVTVAQPVLEALARPMINHRGKVFAELLGRIGEMLRPVFGTSEDVLLLGSSGTGAMEASIANVFSPGDVVLSCPVGVFGKRYAAIAERFGCLVEPFETPIGAAVDVDALRARLTADRERRITGVLLTHNETSTGVQNDMAALAAVLRDHGALSLVDSISGLGTQEFRMDEWGYDVVVTASQKGFAAPPGVAMVATSKRVRERLARAASPRYYFDLQQARESAHEGQMPWTPPIPIIYALEVALQRYHAEGITAAFVRHARYARAVRAAFEALDFTLVSRPGAHSVAVVAAYPPAGVHPARLLERLRDRYGVVLSGGQGELAGKIVRFGTMGDVGEADVLGAVAAIELALGDLGIEVKPGAGSAAAIEALSERVISGVA